MKLSKLKIGVCIAAGFALVLLLMAAIVIVATLRLQSLGAVVDIMVNDTFAKSSLVSRWSALTQINSVRTMSVATDTDPVTVEQTKADMKQTSAQISELQKKLDKLSKNAEESAMFDAMSEKRKEMMSMREAVFKLKATDQERASEMAKAKLAPLLGVYNKTLITLEEYETRSAEVKGAAAATVVADSRQLLIILGAIAALLGITIAAVITLTVKRQLGGEPSYAVEVANRIAAGDLSRQVSVESSSGASLLDSMSHMQRGLVDLVQQVQVGSSSIATACGQIASGNRDLSARTEQQASSLEETASTMEELTTTVKQNAVNAREANDLAASASIVAEKGGKVVAEVVNTMTDINTSARQIADIIGVIDGIAFQTNILALNAAVEAARAGEQGRGFAVVASEVRNLAQRSAGAAKEIKELINASVDKVDRGSKLVSDAGATMDEVVQSIRNVSRIMSDILAASQEQSHGIEQINQAVGQMDSVTQQNAALVEEATAAAEALLAQAQNLDERVAVFKISAGA